MPKNQTKIRLICTAPKHLTTYNPEWNKTVEDTCHQDPKFEPTLTCLPCKYFKAKTYTK